MRKQKVERGQKFKLYAISTLLRRNIIKKYKEKGYKTETFKRPEYIDEKDIISITNEMVEHWSEEITAIYRESDGGFISVRINGDLFIVSSRWIRKVITK
jgi:aspartate carbamoyltransferase catalytic subunit